MKNQLIINSNGKAVKKRRGGVRRSLDYHGIARRPIQDAHISYDRSIDVSAVIIKK